MYEKPITTPTFEPSYIEHSRDTEIGSIQSGFVTFIDRAIRTFFEANQVRGNEKPFDIAVGSLYLVFDTVELDCCQSFYAS